MRSRSPVVRDAKFEAVPFRELAAILRIAAQAVGRDRDDGDPAIRFFEARVRQVVGTIHVVVEPVRIDAVEQDERRCVVGVVDRLDLVDRCIDRSRRGLLEEHAGLVLEEHGHSCLRGGTAAVPDAPMSACRWMSRRGRYRAAVRRRNFACLRIRSANSPVTGDAAAIAVGRRPPSPAS